MIREIKFRGKKLDNGEWVYGSLIEYPENLSWKKGVEIWSFDSEHGEYHEVDPKTVGQLIRKGSESRFDIYAGDILQDDWGYKYVIEWDEQDTVYRARDIITGELETLHGKWVIGIEHDNPELLEVEQ